MNIRLFCSRAVPAIFAVAAITFTSCTVDQEAALFTGGSAAGKSKKEKSEEKSESSFAEKMRIAKEERAKARAEAAEKKAKEKAEQEREEARKLAAKKKEEEALARKEEAEKRAKEAEEKALAEKKALEKKEAEEAKTRELAEKKKAAEEKRAAKIAAREKARAERRAREEREEALAEEEVPAVAERRGGGGLFSRMSISTPGQYKSEGHYVHVNQRLLSSLSPSNAKIEIDLSEQRARIYKNSGGVKQLVIETQVSTGKSGHSTPTGSFRIKEKLVHKRSTLYGRWVSSSGATVRSDGDSRFRPAGGSSFVGAEMPYWMRVSGGVGMHIGYVPDFPASHGCIRVPSAVQPLIYSKVGVGTPVTITY